jgi:DNA-binding NtrC family response regulator
LTGRKALNSVKKKDFQVVFLNIIIPEIRVIVVFKKIKEFSLETKVFMMMGDS